MKKNVSAQKYDEIRSFDGTFKPSGGETKLTVAEISLIVDEIWPMDVI